ncbi:MAG TPA: aminotransferase class III-fold pyridoxal phosphate-dependent enzyme [Gemmatimonadales bacterium]|nr:aminotransferase class III-fold pyridoxal phosphate-dependent enzyme [Gemmatimonadales bacterium]
MPVSLPALSGPALLPVYAQMPVRPVQGRGSWLTDEAGEQWLDAYGGHAVASTGHSHPDVVRAIAEQAGKLLFYSAAVPLALREQLAERLASLCPEPLGKVFLCNSGAEANENALALARKRTGRRNVVSVKGGWHGRTPGVLACTDGARYEEMAKRSGIPLSTRVEFNDVAGLEAVVDRSVAAVIVEPVQGIQGARDCSPQFLRAAREICSAAGAALIFDEIQCGTGRCGAFTAAESYGVVPDALTMAKGLAAGLPAAATVMVPWLAEGLTIGDLGSTFGGGPVICAAALANLDVIERERLVENAIDVGGYLTRRALEIGVSGVQGRGLLLGLRLTRPAAEIQKALFAHRIITGTSADPNVLRLMPPLSFSRSEADLVLDAMAQVL